MKTPKLNSLLICSLYAITLLTACGQSGAKPEISNTAEGGLLPLTEAALISDKPFLSLAQLVKPYSQNHRGHQSDSALARAKMLRQLQLKTNPVKKFFITRGLPFGDDSRLLQQTLAFSRNPSAFSNVRFFEDHDLSLRIEIQNQALSSIVSTFEKRSLDLAQKLAPYIIKEIANRSAQDIEQIKRLTGIREHKVNELVELLKRHEWIFSGYSFSSTEKAQIVFLGLVAGAIVDEFSTNKSVQQIIAIAKDVNHKVKLLSEVCSLIEIIEMNKQQITTDWQGMKAALTNAHSQISSLRAKADKDLTQESEVSRFITDALTGKIRKAKEGSFLSERQEIGRNLEKFVSSAASAANSLDNLLDAAEAISEKVGVTFGKDLKDAITTARTVSSLVSVTNTVMNAYAGGGVIAALGVFGSGGTGLALLGGNPGQSALAADIRAVKQELKEIKMLQKQMIELQLDTVRMIRDLALMSQAQHQEEMMLLRELKGHAMVAEEASRMKIHSNITSCEQMIEFALQNSRSFKALPFQLTSARTGLLAKDQLFKNLRTKDQLKKFIHSWSTNTFQQCQQAFVDAFSFSSAQDSTLKLLINPNDANSAIAFFQRARYSPLLDFMFELQSKRSLNLLATGLHLPVLRFTEIQTKHSYARVQLQNFEHLYDLDTLISTDSLERYVNSLLLLAPIVSFDKNTWLDFISNERALEQSYDLAWRRARRWFEGALALIQSAIAQEALLSGEVLISELLPYTKYALKTKEDCFQATGSIPCAIKSNPVLRKNLLNYAIHRQRKRSLMDEEYKIALDELNVAKMEYVLGSDFVGQIVQTKSSLGKEALGVRWGNDQNQFITELPSMTEVYEEKIVYSENMGRLLVLQEIVADSLVAMTPTLLNKNEQRGLINLYLSIEL